VLKTQGRRGEVLLELHTAAERLQPGMRLWTLAKDGDRREVRIEELWPHKGGMVLRFAGIDSISAAEALRGSELQVAAMDRAKLPDGWVYVSDLAGCAVFDCDRQVGAVEAVEFGAGEAPLLIVKSGDRRFEIPFAEAYLQRLDLPGKRISMQLPDGLLTLDAPLTPEEKQQQGGMKSRKNRS